MSDIRFEGWLHRSGTGGVYQDSAGNVGIASTQPKTRLDIQNGAFQIGPAGICTATTVNTTNLVNATPLTNRNLISNGAMNVAQRETSETGLGASAGYFTLDRYRTTFSNTAGRLTMAQVADVHDGFANAMKLTCTTADTSIGANEYFILQQKFEGQDIQQLKKGSSDAEEFTVSFYVKGNASATYVVEMYDLDNNRQVGKTFSVTTSWTRVELTFPADTTGALDDDNNASLQFGIWLHAGSTYTSGTLATSWISNVSAQRAGGITSFFDSTDRTFFLTGLQLEVGSVATPFEHRAVGDDLTRCQRYYQEISMSTMLMGSTNGSTQLGNVSIPLAVPMRSAPTIASGITYHMWHGDNNGANNDGTALVASSFSDSNNPSHSVLIKGTLNGFSGRTDNRIGGACANSGTPIKLDAEL